MKLVHTEVLASPISSSRLIGQLSMSSHWCQVVFDCFFIALLSLLCCCWLWWFRVVVLRRVSIRTLSKQFVALCQLEAVREVDAASFRTALGRPQAGTHCSSHFFGQSWLPREFFSTEPAQFRTAIQEKSDAFAGLFSRNHTLARHRPSRGPAAKITRALHNAIRITPPPNSWTLYRHR
jgi:hypothetical protein